MRVLEDELQTKARENEMVDKINKIVADLEKLQKPVQPKQKTWKKWNQEQVLELKYEQAFPSLEKN